MIQQIIASMGIIMGRDGTDTGRKRIQQLADNAKFFRQGMKKLGFIIYGNDASPIVPMLIYYPSKISFAKIDQSSHHSLIECCS